MDNKKYYWIRLKTDFFNEDAIDFLLSQKNGCAYVVLYQMLCLKCANSNGYLQTNIGEMIIPYDAEKIVRDTKYFDFDTVTVALELYKKLGLIYEDSNNMLMIANYEEMVGSETKYAEKKRLYRQKKKLLESGREGQSEGQEGGQEEGQDDRQESRQCTEDKSGQKKDIVRQEIRDKRLEYRDKILDIREYSINTKETNTANACECLSPEESEFNTLWELYNKKVDKAKALKAYLKARKGYKTATIRYPKASYVEIKQGIENYNEYIELKNIEPKFKKNFSTWLNGRCWEDDYYEKEKSRVERGYAF